MSMASTSNAAAATGSVTHAADTDPIAKYQTLLPILKESVTNLVRHTAYILQNSIIGQCKQSDIQLLNKCLEDFNNISIQIYHWLNLADKTVTHYRLGNKFSDGTVYNTTNVVPTMNAPNTSTSDQLSNTSLNYTQYLANTKRQVKAVQELRSILTDFADELALESNYQ